MRNIGVVGGLGPLAGVDLHAKIIKNTNATCDQEHIPVFHISCSNLIGDRTAYFLDNSLPNPADNIFTVISKLYTLDCYVIGIPCNSSHIPSIRNKLETMLAQKYGENIIVIHLIVETAKYLLAKKIKKTGLLATLGTYHAHIYQNVLKEYGIEVLLPETITQMLRIHNSIYDEGYGIKTHFSPVTEKARGILLEEAVEFKKRGAENIIMGCSEIPLALSPEESEIPLVDTTDLLAKALIRHSNPHKIKK